MRLLHHCLLLLLAVNDIVAILMNPEWLLITIVILLIQALSILEVSDSMQKPIIDVLFLPKTLLQYDSLTLLIFKPLRLPIQILLELFHMLFHETNADISIAVALASMALHQLLHLLNLKLMHKIFQFVKFLLELQLSTLL